MKIKSKLMVDPILANAPDPESVERFMKRKISSNIADYILPLLEFKEVQHSTDKFIETGFHLIQTEDFNSAMVQLELLSAIHKLNSPDGVDLLNPYQHIINLLRK